MDRLPGRSRWTRDKVKYLPREVDRVYGKQRGRNRQRQTGWLHGGVSRWDVGNDDLAQKAGLWLQHYYHGFVKLS